MRGENLVILMGNLGMSPVIKDLPSGDTLATFPLATTEVWNHEQMLKEETTWHNIVAWKEIADSVRKSELKKSDTIYLKGKIKHRKFKNKEGVEQHVTEIIVDSFSIIKRYIAKEITPAAIV